MGVYEEQIVPIKISRLAEYVSQRKHISLEEALTYIYINPMYDNLYDEGAKWWYLSTEALYELSRQEKQMYVWLSQKCLISIFIRWKSML